MTAQDSNSQRVPPCSAREGADRPLVSPQFGISIPEHRPVGAKLRDNLGNQVANRGRIIVEIGTDRGVEPFWFISFHNQPDSQGS